jgi:hypothetical protein
LRRRVEVPLGSSKASLRWGPQQLDTVPLLLGQVVERIGAA